MIFTPKKPLPLHADPTSIPQFCVICNFSARSILVRCRPEAIQPIMKQSDKVTKKLEGPNSLSTLSSKPTAIRIFRVFDFQNTKFRVSRNAKRKFVWHL